MLQIIFMVLGIVYAVRLIGLSKAGTNLGLAPERLVEWRNLRRRQYIDGIVAGWGSLVATIVVAKLTIDPAGYTTQKEVDAANLPPLLVGIAVLIIGMVGSIRADRRAKAIEKFKVASSLDTPS